MNWKRGRLTLVAVFLVVALVVGLITWLVIALGSSRTEALAPLNRPTQAASSYSLFPPASGTQAEDFSQKSQAITQLFDDAQGEFTASVVDVPSGETVFSRNGETAGVPASSLKTLTVAAALQTFDSTHRFATTTLLGADGTVYLRGGGDVLLGSGENSTAVSGRAGLASLAKLTATALKNDDAAPASVKIVLDDSLFTGDALLPAWDSSLMTSGNISAVQPIAMWGARSSSAEKAGRVSDPALTAAQAFEKALVAALDGSGISVTASGSGDSGGISRGTTAAEAKELAKVEGATVAEVVEFMGEESDNYVAEALGRLVALQSGKPGTFEGGTAAILEKIGEIGVSTEGVTMVDASGLSAENRVSPAQLTGVLSAASRSSKAVLRDVPYAFPIAGLSGTLDARLTDSSVAGVVRAKTGTLTGVTTLTGTLVDESGRQLVFSFFASDVDSLTDARAVLDAAVAELI
ncbi:D-alanyl-D-alanine carboxypeptidase/D-alanyl-D-alanine-endopeptidase (penicillin-binding protein 4) [Neomicrococcus aestuarii]|uniref:D-alanyl-D-alanine carboxypeptidase/D-alanyl-D-alanine-endopeptidase (Penicillin-binding protein 4) n=1 Tax=Neomicrococcus aestuarii TaxID=556325 RepID=A0A7W8WZV9_9MICC|nr:D-alanyl-D-alanine carboxypeptidase/D-alanyl-D-alanine-endopeptidase [Neomicrococcus aestuarii]MBB5512720.1 D-alanyl-D-alanine carboxypeptidase/D-alanyl-D-alanine-endopeptidase (penicillin-binding protein 4) [Neomicrococcus aestuarii]